VELPVYAADRVGIYYKTTNEYQYELKDHLGNVRAVIKKGTTAGTTEILQMTDYYPYGYTIITAGANGYRFGYQGQYAEKDAATGWNEFDLRMYDSRIGRWLSVDPEGEFYSPYLGMGNDPVNSVDPTGGTIWDYIKAWVGAKLYGTSVNTWIDGKTGRKYYTYIGAEVIDGKSIVTLHRVLDKKVRPVAALNLKGTVGLQAGFKIGNPIIAGKVEANAFAFQMFDSKIDLITGKTENDKQSLFNSNYTGIKTESGGALELTVGGKNIVNPKFKYKYIVKNGYNRPYVQDGSGHWDNEVQFSTKESFGPDLFDPTTSGGKPLPLTPSARTSIKTGIKASHDRVVLNAGMAFKAILGFEANLDIGFELY
jgi:RHS repeat-associated protein